MSMKLTYDFSDYMPFTDATIVNKFRKELRVAFKAYTKEGAWRLIADELRWNYCYKAAGKNGSDVWSGELPIDATVSPSDFLDGVERALEIACSAGPVRFEAEALEIEDFLLKWKKAIAKCERRLKEQRDLHAMHKEQASTEAK